MKERIRVVLASFEGSSDELIPVLQRIQAEFGYLPEEAMLEAAQFLVVPESQVYAVASFYAQFRFERQGEYAVRVCQGTACHVRGGRRIMTTVEQELGIHPGGTTEDYKFSLERVACFGSCALAPVMVVDKKVYGRMTTVKAREVLSEY